MLMPLSFATILGGTCSLIGTSTNIVVDGVAQSHGITPFRLFEISGPGVIYGVVGILYFIGRRFLPDRPTLSDTLIDVSQHALEPIATRDLRMMEGIVGPRSSFVGQRVADLDLRRLYDTRILAIHRRNENLHGKFDQVRLQF